MFRKVGPVPDEAAPSQAMPNTSMDPYQLLLRR
jgi:hypothetical protein